MTAAMKFSIIKLIGSTMKTSRKISVSVSSGEPAASLTICYLRIILCSAQNSAFY